MSYEYVMLRGDMLSLSVPEFKISVCIYLTVLVIASFEATLFYQNSVLSWCVGNTLYSGMLTVFNLSQTGWNLYLG